MSSSAAARSESPVASRTLWVMVAVARSRRCTSAAADSACTRATPSFSVWAARCASNSRSALSAAAARSLAACSSARCCGERAAGVLDELGDPGQGGVGGIAVGDEFQPGAFGAGAAAQHEPAEHVARLGDDRERRCLARPQRPPHRARGSQVIGDDDVREQSEHAGRRGDDAAGGQCPVGQGAFGLNAGAGIREEQFDPAEFLRVRPVQGVDRGVAVFGEHGVGERAEGRGDGRFEPGLHLHVFGDEPADARQLRGDQRAGAVLLVEGR